MRCHRAPDIFVRVFSQPRVAITLYALDTRDLSGYGRTSAVYPRQMLYNPREGSRAQTTQELSPVRLPCYRLQSGTGGPWQKGK